MRTRYLNIDFFTSQFLRLPLPTISNHSSQPSTLCFGPQLDISYDLDQFPIQSALTRFFDDVLPKKIDIDIEKKALIPYEDEDVEFDRTYEYGEEKGTRHLEAIKFEAPEPNVYLEEQGVNAFDEAQQQAFSNLPQLEIPPSIENENFKDAIPYPCTLSESVYSVQDINLEYDIGENTDCEYNKSSARASKYPLLEVNEIELQTCIGSSIEEDFHLLLEDVQYQSWTDKADGDELLSSIDLNTLELLPKQYASLPGVVESRQTCLNAVLGMDFTNLKGISDLNADNSKEIPEGVCFSLSPIHFQEVHILECDTFQSFDTFLWSQTAKELETCEQILTEGMDSFYESIISHELALVDDSFKSLPIPHLPDDDEIWSSSCMMEGILSDLKPHPPSASDGIYLDWHLLQEDRCNHDNCSTYRNIFEEIDYIAVPHIQSFNNDLLVIDLVSWNDTPNGVSKSQESKEVLNCSFPEVCPSRLSLAEGKKTGKMDTAKVPDLLKPISQFNDLDFFLNPLKGSTRKTNTEVKIPVSSSNLDRMCNSKDLTFLKGSQSDYCVPNAVSGADMSKDTQLKVDGTSHSTSTFLMDCNDQDCEELLKSLPFEVKQMSSVSSEPEENVKACNVPVTVSDIPFSMGSNHNWTSNSSSYFPDIVVIVNTQDFGKEMLISRRSSYQKILATEKGGAQVVEREMNMPVDLILSATMCLLWYNCRNIGGNATIEEASSCFPDCVENIATNILTLLSFAFTNCILIFEGESKFLYSIMELSDELYAAAASLGIDLQLFCSYSPEFTDEIILSCIQYNIKINRGLYPKMLDSENLAETFLCKFPSINPLSAHAILSSGGRLVDFLECSRDRRIQAVFKYGVSDESIALFNALCRYGEQEDSYSGTTDCSSISSAPDSGHSNSKLESPRKKQKYTGRPPSAKLPKEYQQLDSSISFNNHGGLEENQEIEMSKLFDQPLVPNMKYDLGWHSKAGSEDIDFKSEVIDFDDISLLSREFFPVPNNACLSPEFGRDLSFRGSLSKRVSPPIPRNDCSSYPTLTQINSDLDIRKSSKDQSQMFNEDFWADMREKDTKDDMPLHLRRQFLQENIIPTSASSHDGTPYSDAIQSSNLRQGSPWTVEFLNKIKEKSRKHQKSLLSHNSDTLYGYSNNAENFAKRKSPPTLDGGGKNPKRIFKQKCQKQQLIPQLFGSFKSEKASYSPKHFRPFKSEKASSSLTPIFPPTDKRAKQTLSFARSGKEKQCKLIWSDGDYPGSWKSS